jgi:small subunit ribosomal protein S16
MATTIRLARHGAKKHPFYRIVVADRRAPRSGRCLDQIGTYDPSQDPPKVRIEEDKLALWLRRGALPSLTVSQLIKRGGATPGAQPETIHEQPESASPAEATPAPDPGEAQT